MKILGIYGIDNTWSIGILFCIVHLPIIVRGKDVVSSHVAPLKLTAKEGELSKVNKGIHDVRKESKQIQKGTTKDRIPQTKVDLKTEDKQDGNLVFFQIGNTQKKKQPKKPSSLLLKSSPNPANKVVTVGEGLDLARASILPRKSSPSVVTSCVGNQVTLKCAAEGNPAPEFTWYKGSQTVGREKVAEFDLKIAPSLFTRASHLTITPNGENDFGEYECAATNTLGATQESMHKIVLTDQGEQLCTESTYNKDKKKFNSIIIGTVSSAGMLLVLFCIAGFVFWRLNKKEEDSYQRLKTSSFSTEKLVDGVEASGSHSQASSNEQAVAGEEALKDDFNAKEIGRLSSLLAGDWERLARLLGFHQHDISTIRNDSEKTESRCADMLNRFRRRRGSRETLAESVEEMKDIETATAIRQKYYKANPTD